MKLNHVEGEKTGHIVLYALSTCIWCEKTKKLLTNLGVDFYFVDMDLLNDNDQEKAKEEVMKWNPQCSFPTIVIDNKDCVLGFEEDEIKEKLGI